MIEGKKSSLSIEIKYNDEHTYCFPNHGFTRMAKSILGTFQAVSTISVASRGHLISSGNLDLRKNPFQAQLYFDSGDGHGGDSSLLDQ